MHAGGGVKNENGCDTLKPVLVRARLPEVRSPKIDERGRRAREGAAPATSDRAL